MSKNRGMRNRKISIKSPLSILRASDITDLDEELLLQRSVPLVESGVDKEEENETHLVQAIHSTNHKPVYIPTPDASRVVEGYTEKYTRKYNMPSIPLRFSMTVEDCEGCPYSLDEIDDKWLTEFNVGRKENTQISEDAFEWLVQQFEITINAKQPFLSTAPESILPFDELEPSFDEEGSVASQYKAFAKFVYPHWRERRIKNLGKPLMPLLRYEENAKDEGDPYVCFRRREVRQVRKTRRTDQQSSVKLKSLRTEMELARNLLELIVRRESVKREQLLVEQVVFDKRCKMKELKRKLNIKGDEEELIPSKRSKAPEPVVAPPRAPVRQATRTETDSTLLSIDQYFEEKKAKASALIADKIEQAKSSSHDWCDFTDNPYTPVPQSIPLTFFRKVFFPQESYPSSAEEDYYGNVEDWLTQEQRRTRPSFRQRIGRGGRYIIDRRGKTFPSYACGNPKGGKAGQSKIKPSYSSGKETSMFYNRWQFDLDIAEEESIYVEV